MKKHILIIEDNPVAMMVEKQLIESMNFRVNEAFSGNDGLKIVQKNHNKYLLVLMDIGLPDISGIEVTLKLREYEALKKIQPLTVVALTGNDNPTQHQACLDAGMSQVLSKPLTKELFLSILSHPKA